MYILKETKNNIQDYKAIESNLYYKIKGADYSLYQNDILIDNENYGFFFFENFYGLNHKNSTDLINIVSNEKITIPVTFNGNGVYQNNFIVSTNMVREGIGLYSNDYVVCQLLPFKELYKLPYRYYGSGYRLKNQYIQIQHEKKILKSLSLLTGEYEWEVDLSEYGEIRSVLMAVKENLWILANDYKINRHSLLRLDANSGRVMQILGEALKLSDAHVKYIEEKQNLLSFKSSISSTPSPSTLIEVDAKTGEILRNVTVESMLEPNLKVGLWQYQDNQLFFTANTTMMTTTHIGILDYDTLELLWSTEVPDRKGLLKDIQVSSDKIYVLDQVGTLHIFEKEID